MGLGAPLPRILAIEVLEALRRARGVRSADDTGGLPVEILTPRDMPLHPSTVCTPKYNGDRMTLFARPFKRIGTVLHFVDRAMRVFDGGILPIVRKRLPDGTLRQAPRQLSYVLDGELTDCEFTVFDVLAYKGKPCLDARPLLDRLKFAVPILRGIPRRRVGPKGSAITVRLKPMYDQRVAAAVHAWCAEGAFRHPTDGIVFAGTRHPREQPRKFKDVTDVTCDFKLVNNNRLHLDAGNGRQVFVDCVDRATRTRVADKIVECRFVVGAEPIEPDPDSDLPPGRWEIVRERPDKVHANSTRVFDRNAQLIAEDFTFERLLKELKLGSKHAASAVPNAAAGADGASGGARMVAGVCGDHRGAGHGHGAQGYFAPGAVARSRSKSVAMKNQHNFVKDAAYAAYSTMPGTTHILELGVGRGGDFFRIGKHARLLQEMVGVDIDALGLKEAKRRWKMVKQPGQAATFLEMNLDEVYAAHRLCDKYENHFQLASAHFSAHYFIDTLPEIASTVLVPNGHLVCTLFDSKAVRAALHGTATQQFKREWRIDGELQTSLQLVDSDGKAVESARAATHVAVFVDTIGQVIVERLVDIDSFVERMDDQGMACVDRRSFSAFHSDFYLESNPMFGFSALYILLAFQKRPVDGGAAKMPWED